MQKIFLFLIVLFGIWLLRRKLFGGAQNTPRETSANAPRQDAEPEAMLACAQCGVHVPRSEGLEAGGLFYCSEAHRLLGPRRGQ